MKRTLLLLLSTLALISCGENDLSNKMLVTGEIKGLKKGVVYLQHVPDSTLISMDSVIIAGDGKFQFEIPLDEPQLFYLFLEKADENQLNDRVAFFGEPGEIVITSTWNAFEQDVAIKGSESHDLLEEYRKVITRFNTKDLEILQASYSEEIQADSAAVDSLQGVSDNNLLRRYLYTLNFSLNNRHSHLAPYLAVKEVPDANLIYLDSIYGALPEDVANGKYGKSLKELIEERRSKQGH